MLNVLVLLPPFKFWKPAPCSKSHWNSFAPPMELLINLIDSPAQIVSLSAAIIDVGGFVIVIAIEVVSYPQKLLSINVAT